MKIGRKNGELCVEEAHLPITIHTKIVDGIPAVNVKEHGEPDPAPYEDELGHKEMSERLRFHIKMIEIHLESLNDDELAKAWIKRVIQSMFSMLSLLVDGKSVSKNKYQLIEQAESINDEAIKNRTKKIIEDIFNNDPN